MERIRIPDQLIDGHPATEGFTPEDILAASRHAPAGYTPSAPAALAVAAVALPWPSFLLRADPSTSSNADVIHQGLEHRRPNARLTKFRSRRQRRPPYIRARRAGMVRQGEMCFWRCERPIRRVKGMTSLRADRILTKNPGTHPGIVRSGHLQQRLSPGKRARSHRPGAGDGAQ